MNAFLFFYFCFLSSYEGMESGLLVRSRLGAPVMLLALSHTRKPGWLGSCQVIPVSGGLIAMDNSSQGGSTFMGSRLLSGG